MIQIAFITDDQKSMFDRAAPVNSTPDSTTHLFHVSNDNNYYYNNLKIAQNQVTNSHETQTKMEKHTQVTTIKSTEQQ